MSEAQPAPRKKSVARQAIMILVLICLGSGGGVGLVYWRMKAEMEAKAASAFHSALAAVLGEAQDYSTVGAYPEGTKPEDEVYVSNGPSGVFYAAMGQAQGYSSFIKVLVSVEAPAPKQPVGESAVIHALIVADSNETPGLGENVKAVRKTVSIWAKLGGKEAEGAGPPPRPWFQEQFTGKALADLVVVKQRHTDKIAAITGATITSNAVCQAARQAIQKIIEKTKEVYPQ